MNKTITISAMLWERIRTASKRETWMDDEYCSVHELAGGNIDDAYSAGLNEALQHLNEAIEFIKGVAPEVWAIYVRQQIIEGAIAVGAMGLGWVALITGLHFGKAREWEPGPWTVFAVVGLVFATAGTVISLEYGLSQLLNPEYWAIKELLP